MLRLAVLLAGTIAVAANGILTYRISCLTGAKDSSVTWHWGWPGGSIAGTCDGQILAEYLVVEQWPVLLLAAALGIPTLVLCR